MTKICSTDLIFDPKADSALPDEALRSKKNRYVNFDAKTTVTQIAAEALGAKIVRVEPLGVGKNAFDHLVYRAYTDKGLKVVFRLNTDSIVAKHFMVEATLYDIWHRAGISSPEVYNITLRNKKNDPDYILLENVGTHDLEEYLRHHPRDLTTYAFSSGAFLRHLHTVSLEGFGILELKDEVLQGSQKTWKEAIHVRLEENLKYLVKHHLLTLKQEKEIRNTFVKNDKLLELETGTTLHGDYHNANIIIDEVSGKVIAAIDLSQAKVGDPLYDVAFYGTYVSKEIFDLFCKGYFGHSKRPPNLEKKLALYQLRIYLSKAKLRKRFGYEERIGAASHGIVDSLKKLT
ncbi:MAG: aminoglycoside phosphotransferase family protein [Candidatus Paceibacterota bacterium]|jgi:aminoglycoside phosphotransferase (APT) family kinase protein